jgi:hypothetical protein
MAGSDEATNCGVADVDGPRAGLFEVFDSSAIPPIMGGVSEEEESASKDADL